MIIIADMINDADRRAFAINAETATLLCQGSTTTTLHPSTWEGLDALLFPLHFQSHWRLAVADVINACLYFLDTESDPPGRPLFLPGPHLCNGWRIGRTRAGYEGSRSGALHNKPRAQTTAPSG